MKECTDHTYKVKEIDYGQVDGKAVTTYECTKCGNIEIRTELRVLAGKR